MSKTKIYFAAALFNGREKLFNEELSRKLENRGYDVFRPQRDGFEFSMLNTALQKHLPVTEIDSAVQDIIYYYDMGVQLPDSHVVVANLDEPIDEGVVVEISYANLMGKPIIGFRTDARGPYGDSGGRFGGMHFFPAYQCDTFIRFPFYRDIHHDVDLSNLSDMIENGIKKRAGSCNKLEDYVVNNPWFSQVLEGAEILFNGIKGIHSKSGLEKLAKRYKEKKNELEKFATEVVRSI